MEIRRNLRRGIGQESFWQECQEVIRMLESLLTRLISDFEGSWGDYQPPRPVRELLTKTMLTFSLPPEQQCPADDRGKRREAEKLQVGRFADHLEELTFSKEYQRWIAEGSIANLLARLTVASGDGEKLFSRWQVLCEILSDESSPHHFWVRYRYPVGCRDRFLEGVMVPFCLTPAINPGLLKVMTSALGVMEEQTTSTSDGGSYETATLTKRGNEVAKYIKSHAKSFGAELIFVELNRIRKVARPTRSETAVRTLHWALLNVLADRFSDTSPLMSEILRQVDRLFPQNADVGKALAALQALELPI